MELLALFAILQIADGYTTHRILQQGGSELNPIMAMLFEEFGHLPVLVLLKAGLVGLSYFYIDPWQYGELLLGLMCVFYSFVVLHNCGQMKMNHTF